METSILREKTRTIARKVLMWFKNVTLRQQTIGNLLLIFLLALGSGMLIKALVNDRLTIGFDDYRLSRARNIIDLNALQKEVIRSGGTLATTEKSRPLGKSCAEKIGVSE